MMHNNNDNHTASSVAQDKVTRVQVLGRGASSKNRIQSPGASSEESGIAPRMATITTTQAEHQAEPTESVSGASAPTTTSRGKKSQRMKWSIEMNIYLMRSYYEVTNLETNMSTYRMRLHSRWIEKYPGIDVTEQRLATQKANIVAKNLIAPAIMEKIKKEVRDKLTSQSEPEVTSEPTTEAETSRADATTEPETTNETSREDAAIEEEWRRALTEFVGMDPTKTHHIPKQKPTKKLWQAIQYLNHQLVPEYLAASEITLETIRTAVYCAAVTATRINGTETRKQIERPQSKKFQVPPWERRLRQKIEDLRVKIGQLTQYHLGNRSKKLAGKVRSILKNSAIHTRHEATNKRVEEHLDTLKQTLLALSKRLRRYKESYQRRTNNKMFSENQSAFYRKLGQEEIAITKPPEKKDIEKFWEEIWSNEVKHDDNAPWINPERNRDIGEMEDWRITEDDVAQVIGKTHNWKTPGIDNIHNYWYKRLNCTHKHLAEQFTRAIEDPSRMPEYLTWGITYLKPKDEDTSNPAKYRPITCLPTMYKILTSCITKKLADHVGRQDIMAEQQKGCQEGSQGCKEQLTIDAVVMQEACRKQRNLYTTYIDYRKAFDSVPHSWLIETLKIYKVNPNVTRFLAAVMAKWKTTIKLQNITTDPIQIRRGIFQGDALSPLWFCLALNPLSTMLNESKYGYTIRNGKKALYTLSHLMYMDDIKLYAATEKQLQQLLKITEDFSRDIKMDFGLDKCKTHGLHRGKPTSHSYELESGEEIKAMAKGETYKYLGMLQTHRLEHMDMKSRLSEKYHRRLSSILKAKLNSGNTMAAINTYAAPVLTYSFGIVRWSATDLEDIMRKTRTTMTRHRQHHPKSAIERLTIARKDGGRGLVDLAEQQRNSIDKLREYFLKSAKPVHQAIRKIDKGYTPLNLSSDVLPGPTGEESREESWGRKILHGRHFNDLRQEHVDRLASNAWLVNGTLFPETEALMLAIQDQVISTRNYRKYITKDPSVTDDSCRKCRRAQETIQHITAGCEKIAQSEYTYRHNQVANIIHQNLAKNHNMVQDIVPYYEYQPRTVLETAEHKLYWDRTIRTDKTIPNNRPDITLVDKKSKAVILIDIAVPNTGNLQKTHQEKIRKYEDLRQEVKEMWHMERVTTIPVVVSATGVIPTTLHTSLKSIGLHENIYMELQKAAIQNTCKLVRKFLEVT